MNMSQDTTHLVFTYGTLKRGEPNYEVMTDKNNGSCKFMGCGETVDKYPLVVGTEYNVPFMIKVENKGHNIRGELYEVDDKMLASLDEFECHPKLYLRQDVDIRMTEDKDENPVSPPQIKKCGVYFLTDIREEMMKLKWLSEYHSVSEDHPEYVKRCDRKTSILDVMFPNE